MLLRLRLLPIVALLGACSSSPNTDPEPLQLEVGEFQFDAVTAGPEDGELVVLLHGFPETSFAYRKQLPALAAAGFRAVALDQRGYSPGARPDAVEDYALPHLVADVIGVVDALGRDEFHVVGHDWGAAVAWFTAMAHPDRVRTVTAFSVPHPMAFQQAMSNPNGDQAQRSTYMGALRAEGAEEALVADGASRLRAVYGDRLDDEAIDRYVAALGTPDAMRAALNWYRAMGASVPFGRLTPIEMPALYVWSTDDATMGREGAELTANFVQGPYRFEILEGVSHWIPEEAADQVNAMLLEHLASE